MKPKNTLEDIISKPVSRIVFKNAVPAILSMLMVLIYNLADTFFIGQTHDALQVAAVSLATPVFTIFIALGAIFGIGGTSAISRALGENRREHARKISAFCMWSCVGVGILALVIVFLFMNPILTLIGASENTWELAHNYLSIILLGAPFTLISSCFSNILRAEGQPTKAMTGMLIGNLLNIALDPITIFGFGWGISGVAVATVTGNLVAALYYILYFVRGKSSLSISIKNFTVKNSVCKSVLAIGLPASLSNLLMSISQMVTNTIMADYGDMAVAGIGVSVKVTMIVSMVSIGLGQGIQPLLGYCIGGRHWERYRKILRFSLIVSLIMGAALTSICYLFIQNIVNVFLTQADAFEYGVQFSRILLVTSFLFGLFYCIINALQAMGAAVSSLIANISRQGIFYIPVILIFTRFLEIPGLVWAQPLADVLALLLAFLLYRYSFSKLKNKYA